MFSGFYVEFTIYDKFLQFQKFIIIYIMVWLFRLNFAIYTIVNLLNTIELDFYASLNFQL